MAQILDDFVCVGLADLPKRDAVDYEVAVICHAYAYRDGAVIVSPRAISDAAWIGTQRRDWLEAALDEVCGSRPHADSPWWIETITESSPPFRREMEIDRVADRVNTLLYIRQSGGGDEHD